MNNTTDNYPQDSSFVQTYSQESFIQGINLLTKQNMVQGLCDVDLTPALDPAPAPAGPQQANNLNFDLAGTVLGSDSQSQLVSISQFSWKSRKSVQSKQTNVTTISQQKIKQKEAQVIEFQKFDKENFTSADKDQRKQDVGIFEFKKSERASLIHADEKQNQKVLEFQKIGTRDLDIVELKLQKSSDFYAQVRSSKTNGSYPSVRAKFSQVEKEKKKFDDLGEYKSTQNTFPSSLKKERQKFNQLVRGSFVNSTKDQFSSIQPIYVENSSERRESSPDRALQTGSSLKKDNQKFNQLIRGSFADIPDKQFSSIQKDNFSSNSRKNVGYRAKSNKFVKEKTQFNTLVRGSFCDEKQQKTKFLVNDEDDKVVTVERSEFKRGSHVGDVQYCRGPVDGADQSIVSRSIESKFGDKRSRGSLNKFDSGCGLEVSSPSSKSKDSEEQVFEGANSQDLENSDLIPFTIFQVSQQGVSEGALEQVSQFNKGIVQVSDCDVVENIRTKGSDIAEKFKRLYPLVKQENRRRSSDDVPYLQQQQAQKQGGNYRGAQKDEEEQFEGSSDVFKQSGFDGLENEECLPDFANIMPNIKYAVTI